jgi:hypothetical protein
MESSKAMSLPPKLTFKKPELLLFMRVSIASSYIHITVTDIVTSNIT